MVADTWAAPPPRGDGGNRGNDGLGIAYDKAKWELDPSSVQRVMTTQWSNDLWCDRHVLVASFTRRQGGARVRVANFHGPLWLGPAHPATATTKIKNAMSTQNFGGPGVLQILLGDFNNLNNNIGRGVNPNMVWDDATFVHAFNSGTDPQVTKLKNFDHIAVAGTALVGGTSAKFTNKKVLEGGSYSDHPIIKIGIPVNM
eukprot:g14889.t1